MVFVLGWEIENVDIKGEFLYARLTKSDKIVIRFSSIDRVKAENGQYVRLLRSFYGI